MIVAEFFIIAPVIAAITMGGVASVLGRCGCRPWVWALLGGRRPGSCCEKRESRSSGVVAGFGAGISEVGAVNMVGGNLSIAGHNQTGTMTTAIMELVGQGQFATAMALGIILIVLAFIITFILTRTQQGFRRRWLQS